MTERSILQTLEQLPGNLLQLDARPHLGSPPSFPWQELAKELEQRLEIEPIAFSEKPYEWRAEGEVLSGLTSPKFLKITLSPLEGDLYFAIGEQDITNIASLLHNKTLNGTGLPEEIVDGFITFLGLEVLSILRSWKGMQSLSPQIKESNEIPSGEMLTITIEIKVMEHTFIGRLLFTPLLQKNFTKHFYRKTTLQTMDATHLENIPVTLGINIGEVALSKEEWKELKPGDFLVLDHCTCNLKEEKTKVLLTLEENPLFRGKIKSGKIKILEHPLRYEKG